jgi:hypothetical protein
MADSLDLVDTSEQTLLEMTLKQKLTQRIKDPNYQPSYSYIQTQESMDH